MFSNVRLRNKLLLSFFAVLILMAIASTLAYKQFEIVGHKVKDYTHIVAGASAASHIESAFLNLRSHAREYALTAKPEDAQTVHKIGQKLSLVLKEAMVAEDIPERLKALQNMQHDVDRYLSKFATVEDLEKRYRQLIKTRLMPEGEKITLQLDGMLKEAAVQGNDQARGVLEEALQHAFLARLYSNLIIGNKDETATLKAETEFASLQESVKNILKDQQGVNETALVKEVASLVESYENTLKALVADTNEIHQIVNVEMKASADDLIASAERLLEDAKNEETQLEQSTLSNIATGETELIVIGVVCFGCGVLFAWLLGGALAKPINAMTNVMNALAHNDMEIKIPYTENGDELGDMATSVHLFKEKMLEVKRLQKAQQEDKLKAEAQRRVAIMKMADVFESSVGKVVEAVTSAASELQASAGQMAITARETSQQTTAVSSATEEASSNVQTVAAATEELSSANNEIGRNVQQSAKMSASAADIARNTQKTVSSMVDEVGRIASFAELINDIADQTNMLALNATIESAHAGEAGKGFAVVAQEVKKLAQQTADATEEIVSQIRQVNAVTQKAASEIATVGKSILEADRLSSSVAAAVEEQVVATQEIARSVEEAARGTQEVARNIVMVEAASNETGSAAEQISMASGELASQAEYLKEEVARFLNQVRVGDNEKRLLEWEAAMETGIHIIDEHHKDMMEEINFYHGKMMKGISREEVEAGIARLLVTFKEHLGVEKSEMSLCNYPDIDEHIQDHEKIIIRLDEILRQHDEGLDISLDFFDAISSWMVEHTAVQDKKFAQFVIENHLDMKLQQAAQ